MTATPQEIADLIARLEETQDDWPAALIVLEREAAAALLALAEREARLRESEERLAAACAEFVRKVEAGEARSVHSYTQMKLALRDRPAALSRQEPGHD